MSAIAFSMYRLAGSALTLANQVPVTPLALAGFLGELSQQLQNGDQLRNDVASRLRVAADSMKLLEQAGHAERVPNVLRDLSVYLNTAAKQLEISPVTRQQGKLPLSSPVDLNDLELLIGDFLILPEELHPLFQNLSLDALRALYVLASEGVSREALIRFLENKALQYIGGPNAVLNLIAKLYDLEVVGFAAAFEMYANAKFQVNYLSTQERHLKGQWAEHCEAARIAAHPDIAGVLLNVAMPIDWSILDREQREWLFKVSGLLPRNLRDSVLRTYRRQKTTQVDLVVQTKGGTTRLVEVKSSKKKMYSLNNEVLFFLLIQMLRHSILQKQKSFDGVEFYFDIDELDRRIEQRLREASEVFQIPLTITAGRQNNRRVLIGDLPPLPRLSLDVISPKSRALVRMPR